MKKGYIYILLSTILFSSMEVALKLTSASFNPLQITFLRFAIGTLVLLPFGITTLKKRGVKLNGDDLKFFTLTGFIGIVVSMMIYQLAVIYAPAAVVAVLFSCNPIFVTLFALMLLHEKIYKHTVITLILSVIGILFVINPASLGSHVAGMVLTILSAIAFALYGVVGKKRAKKYGGFALTCFSFLMGSIELLILIGLGNLSPVATLLTNGNLGIFAHVSIFTGISSANLLGLIYIGVFVTGFGYATYNLAMETTSAATASLVFFVKPVLAPILAMIFIHEAITFNMLIGIILIVIGSLISFIAGNKHSGEDPKTTEEVQEILELDVE